MRYKLTISYNGTSYCGWQTQKTGLSIQHLIEEALKKILQHPTELKGAGRTDTGVHARGQTAHFDTLNPIPPLRIKLGLNCLLPLDIRILEIDEMPPDFHARYSAISKIYHYHLHLDPTSDPFMHLYRHTVRGPCDLKKIAKALPYLIGTHDFTSFANKANQGSASKGAVRTLYRLDMVEEKGGIRLELQANGFLYKMVRNIVGLLLCVGAKKIEPEAVIKIIESKTRQNPFKPAPAKGLFLHEVCYKSIFSNESK